MNAERKQDELWADVSKVVEDMYPALRGWRVRGVAREGGFELWTGSNGEFISLIEDASLDAFAGPADNDDIVTKFRQEQTLKIDPLPGHLLVSLEPKSGTNTANAVVVHVPLVCLTKNFPSPHPETKVSMQDVEREIVRETYTILPSGKAIACELTLIGGRHTEVGVSQVVDPRNFDWEEGKKAARSRAINGVFTYLAARRTDFVPSHIQD